MKRILVSWIFGVFVLAATALVSTKPTIMKTHATVRADEQPAPCSLAGAAGKWSFTDNGTVVGIGPRVAVGRFALHSDGHLVDGVAASSLNGNIAGEKFYGTYTVNPDCSGTIDVQIFDSSSGAPLLTVTGFTAYDDNMHQLRGVFTSVAAPNGASLPTVIALEAKKQ